jgi:hypothetical protein
MCMFCTSTTACLQMHPQRYWYTSSCRSAYQRAGRRESLHLQAILQELSQPSIYMVLNPVPWSSEQTAQSTSFKQCFIHYPAPGLLMTHDASQPATRRTTTKPPPPQLAPLPATLNALNASSLPSMLPSSGPVYMQAVYSTALTRALSHCMPAASTLTLHLHLLMPPLLAAAALQP